MLSTYGSFPYVRLQEMVIPHLAKQVSGEASAKQVSGAVSLPGMAPHTGALSALAH